MRDDMAHGTGTWMAEALDAASGGVVFLLMVVFMAMVAGITGWAAGSYMTAAILFGCCVLAVIAMSATWGVLHWGIDQTPSAPTQRTDESVDDRFRHAA
jgi:hypothetical protein